jgi:hypothetical protein
VRTSCCCVVAVGQLPLLPLAWLHVGALLCDVAAMHVGGGSVHVAAMHVGQCTCGCHACGWWQCTCCTHRAHHAPLQPTSSPLPGHPPKQVASASTAPASNSCWAYARGRAAHWPASSAVHVLNMSCMSCCACPAVHVLNMVSSSTMHVRLAAAAGEHTEPSCGL